MGRKVLTLSLLLIVISLSACELVDAKRAEAIDYCKDLIPKEGETIELALLGDFLARPRLVYGVSPETGWHISYKELAVSQRQKMQGIDWRAQVNIDYAVEILHEGWVDVCGTCFLRHTPLWGWGVESYSSYACWP